MADKNKGAKHLTDLTLGIEGIKDALDEAQKMIEERSIELGKIAAENIQKGFGTEDTTKELKESKIVLSSISEEGIKGAKKHKEVQKELGEEIDKTNNKSQGFLKTITDKAKWLSAFYIIDAIKQGLIEAVKVIKETEDAVVQLQRVMNEDVSKSAISGQLYDIAQKYARSFTDVQDVAVKFAQTGATWEDTIKLTESAMLALNTAELDVQQSTEGLIAITSQWNIGADEMQDVIDKINITADKFPVTSEKIISALQRASSSAKNANLSLEETIGVITALSKATGRSGESIGTAINSILIYTSKSKALETFYEIGNETVKKTVDAYRSGTVSILEVWKALSENLKNLSKEQQDALLNGIDFKEMATHLNEEAAGILEDIQKVYGVAGTHRQNWFVGLLNDIDKVEEVTDNMTDAIGYSAEENKKYLGTLSAYYTQFKEIWKELAVQLGEGSLGINAGLKVLLSIGSALGVVIKHTGGLINVLKIAAGVLLQIKAQKIQEKFLSPAIESIKQLRINTLQFVDTLRTARAAGSSWSQSLKAAGASVDSLSFSLGTLQIALGSVTAVYSLITSAVDKANQKIQESNRMAIERFETTSAEADSTKKLYNEFLKLKDVANKTASQQQEFSQTTLELANRLKIATKNADGASKTFSQLAKDVEDAGKKIGQLTEGEWKYYEEALEYEFKLAGKTKGLFGILVNDLRVYANELTKVSPEIRKNIEDIMGEYLVVGNEGAFFAPGKDQEEGFYKATVAAKQYFDEVQKNRPLTEEEQKIYGRLIDVINELEGAFTKLQKKRAAHFIATNQELVANANTVEGYNALIEAISKYIGVGDNMSAMVEGLVKELLPNLNVEIEETATVASLSADELETLTKSISGLNKEIDSMQSGMGAAYNALEEYQKQGYLSIDTIQSLTNAGLEYANLLDITDNGVKLNEEATVGLINAQRENVVEMIKQSTAAQILELAHKELGIQIKGAKEEGDNLSQGLTGVGAELQNVAIQALNSAISMEKFKVSLQEALGAESDYDDAAFKRFQEGAQAFVEGGRKMIEQVQQSGTAEQYVPEAAKKAEQAVKSRYDAEKKGIETTKKAINDRYNEEKKRLEEQKNAIKEKYNAEIDGLKEVQKENSRLDKQEEYIRNKRKAEEDIQKSSTRSGIEYREKEQEAREKLEDLETDWNKVLRDWSIEDRIKSLEKVRDAEIASIDAQIKAREKLKDEELKSVEARLKALETEKNAKIEVGNQILGNTKKNSKDANEFTQQTAAKTTHEIADMWQETLLNGSKDMQEKAEVNARKLYSSYKKSFVAPLSNDLAGIAFQIRHMNPDLPLAGFDFYSKSMADLNSYKQNPNPIYNNSQTKNSFMVANITGESAAKGITKDFWTMP